MEPPHFHVVEVASTVRWKLHRRWNSFHVVEGKRVSHRRLWRRNQASRRHVVAVILSIHHRWIGKYIPPLLYVGGKDPPT